MFDTVTGLPVHVLVTHAVVVLLPLGALGVVALAAVPRWRRPYGPLVLATLTVGLVLTPVATESGQRLEQRVNASGVVARQIREHTELGDLVVWPALLLWVLTAAMVWSSRRRRPGRATSVVAIAAAVVALGTGLLVARVGHLGSTAVWSCTIGSAACR